MKSKRIRIIANIYDIITQSTFEKVARRELNKDLKWYAIELDYDKGTITLFDHNRTRALYTIKIIKGDTEMKLYTREEILKKYKGKYIKVHPHYYEKGIKDDWAVLFEVIGVSKKIKENYQTPEEAIEE